LFGKKMPRAVARGIFRLPLLGMRAELALLMKRFERGARPSLRARNVSP
jgi:hypothetical protein